jgi:caffeoyl-CoA O-methyltransferase
MGSSFIVPEELERYAEKYSSPERTLLKELAKETYASAEFPQMQVGHLEGLFLNFLVRALKAKRVLEIGTFTGYSALAMAEALPPSGRLWTCDCDPKATSMAAKYWKRSPHGRKIKLVLGEARETLPHLKGPFDLVFIDADKENYKNYWELCLPKIRPGGWIAVDNVLWSGRVLRPKSQTDRAVHAFNQFAAGDKRVELVMLTVRDGITLAQKKEEDLK